MMGGGVRDDGACMRISRFGECNNGMAGFMSRVRQRHAWMHTLTIGFTGFTQAFLRI
jgi:hypothetical protein